MTHSATDEWFAPGLRFRCLGVECGDCCSGKHGPGAVWLTEDDLERLADGLGLELPETERRYTRRLAGRLSLRERPNFDCIFYRQGDGCGVYEHRPAQCRTYPFWIRILESPTTWQNEAEVCPGIGYDNTFVPLSDIRRKLASDRQRVNPEATKKP